MNAQSQAQRAYAAASAPTRTSKGIEYDVVARITHRLSTAQTQGSAGFPALVSALHDNKKLWTIFAIDVADSANPLPKDLKARLFYLAEFTRQHTSKVLNRTDDVTPLIEINMAILRGLRSGAA